MNVNAGETAIEWAPFIKASGVTDEQLVARADVVNSGFIIKQISTKENYENSRS